MAFKSANSLYMIAQFRTASLKKKEAIARLLLPPNHLRPFLRNLTSENEVKVAKHHIKSKYPAVRIRKWDAILEKYDGTRPALLPRWVDLKLLLPFRSVASRL